MQMFREIKSDLNAMDQNRSEMRMFGLLLGAIFLALAGTIYFLGERNSGEIPLKLAVLTGLGLLSILLAIAVPKALKPVNTVFLIVSMIIGWIMTRIVLITLFFGMFLPIGLILRIAGKDSLRLKLNRDIESYWILRSDESFDPARCRRLF